MQDKTINNAILALYRQGGDGMEHVKALMELRGLKPQRYYHRDPFRRGECKRVVLALLSEGPCTSSRLAERIQELKPGVTRRRAIHRAYMALVRLEGKGLVRREGRVWLAR